MVMLKNGLHHFPLHSYVYSVICLTAHMIAHSYVFVKRLRRSNPRPEISVFQAYRPALRHIRSRKPKNPEFRLRIFLLPTGSYACFAYCCCVAGKTVSEVQQIRELRAPGFADALTACSSLAGYSSLSLLVLCARIANGRLTQSPADGRGQATDSSCSDFFDSLRWFLKKAAENENRLTGGMEYGILGT